MLLNSTARSDRCCSTSIKIDNGNRADRPLLAFSPSFSTPTVPSRAKRNAISSRPCTASPAGSREVKPDENIGWLEYEDETPGRWFVKSVPDRLFRTSNGVCLMRILIGNRANCGPPKKPYYRIITREQALVWLKHEGYDAADFDALAVAETIEPKTGDQKPATAAKLTPGGKALAAAYDLAKKRKPVSIRAACTLAKIARSNLKRYPDETKAIESIAHNQAAEKRNSAPRGSKNARSGKMEAWENDDE